MRYTYEHRLANTKNKLLTKLFSIIIEKKSNLCVAVNFKTIEETLAFIDAVGPHICMLKTQCERYGGNLEDNLKKLAKKKEQFNFLLFEDRKFYDLPETIESIYESMYIKYADIVTVIPSTGTFEALERAIERYAGEPRGSFAVCELSFSQVNPKEVEHRFSQAQANPNSCCGIIAQTLNVTDPLNMIKATPGVHMTQSTDGKSQNYNSPEKVIGAGADIIIVGRGIVSAAPDQLVQRTIDYKEAAYSAYLKCVSQE